jgi:hypothetical protein
MRFPKSLIIREMQINMMMKYYLSSITMFTIKDTHTYRERERDRETETDRERDKTHRER